MEKFTCFTGLVAPLDRANVDTDAIIPKQYLKSIKRTGFGVNLFDEWRYLEPGEPDSDHSKRTLNPDFVLNQPRYQGAGILLARQNFGCGSSREHAPWALMDYGFRVLISSSFADIFATNCVKNGILPIVVTDDILDQLFSQTIHSEGFALTVDLTKQTIASDQGHITDFTIAKSVKQSLLQGLDEIALTLQHKEKIKSYEKSRALSAPWLFGDNVND